MTGTRTEGRSLLRTLYGAIIVGLIACSAADAVAHHESGRTSIYQPLWRFDLHTVGYTAYIPPQMRTYGAMPGPVGLSFSDRDTLITSFVEPSAAPTLATRGKIDEKLAYRLYGIFLNLPDGKLQATREWPVTNSFADIVGIGKGRFLQLTPVVINMYSADFRLIKQAERLDLPNDDQKLLTEYALSPTANLLKTQYVWQNNDKIAHISWLWFELPSLTSRHWYFDLANASGDESKVRRQKFTGFLTFTDREVAITRIDPWLQRCTVLLSDWSRKWRTVAWSRLKDLGNHCEEPQFVGDGLLALANQGGFRVLRTENRKTLCKGVFGADTRMRGPLRQPLASSRDGSRLAVPLWRYKSPPAHQHPLTGYSLDRVEIYDLHTGKLVTTVRPPDAPSRSVSALALSPDGSRLAIVVDGVVEVFRVAEEAGARIVR